MSLSTTSIPPWADLGSGLNRKRLRRVIQFVLGPALLIAVWWVAYAGLLTLKFLKERPQVARKVVEVIDAATKLANAGFDKYKPIIPKYTPIRADQLDLLAKPYLRAFAKLNDTDLNSYQALVDVFQKEGVLQSRIDVRDKILKTADFGS